jgi:hypothetical protein
VVVAKSPIQTIRAVARERGWNHGILFDFTPRDAKQRSPFSVSKCTRSQKQKSRPRTSGGAESETFASEHLFRASSAFISLMNDIGLPFSTCMRVPLQKALRAP